MNKVNISDEILDQVAIEAQRYVRQDRERWLSGHDEETKNDVLIKGTHNFVYTLDQIEESESNGVDMSVARERRELHRTIIELQAQTLSDQVPDRPTVFYIGGAMAAGKSTLKKSFDDRIAQEKEHKVVAAFSDEKVEGFFQKYKEISQHVCAPDYGLYKENIPEFEQNNMNFSYIRPEASGLAVAVQTLAKRNNANLIMEGLVDTVRDGWYEKDVQKFNAEFIVMGVTCDPALNYGRLQERGDDIPISQLADIIKKGSSSGGFMKRASLADRAILISTNDESNPKVIFTSKNGIETSRDFAKFSEFESYGKMEIGELTRAMVSKNAYDLSPDQPQGLSF